MFVDLEMVEGNDRPKELPRPKFFNDGKNGGLLLNIMQCICHTAKYVGLDYGFCVLPALVTLKEIGVFANAVIKNNAIGQH